MRVFFLDIDGVLNNCMSIGVFDPTSTDVLCIAVINEAIRRVGAKVIIISTWKDNYDFESIRNLLYSRGFEPDSIIDYTEKDSPKELGILNYLQDNNVSEFVIIDDNLELSNIELNKRYVRTPSMEGIQLEHLDLIVNLFQ